MSEALMERLEAAYCTCGRDREREASKGVLPPNFIQHTNWCEVHLLDRARTVLAEPVSPPPAEPPTQDVRVDVTCPACKGRGHVDSVQDGQPGQEWCETCGGLGVWSECRYCREQAAEALASRPSGPLKELELVRDVAERNKDVMLCGPSCDVAVLARAVLAALSSGRGETPTPTVKRVNEAYETARAQLLQNVEGLAVLEDFRDEVVSALRGETPTLECPCCGDDGPERTRIETGPVKFGDDWTGLFIRGDACVGYMLALEIVMKSAEKRIETSCLNGLIRLLAITNEQAGVEPQRIQVAPEPPTLAGPSAPTADLIRRLRETADECDGFESPNTLTDLLREAAEALSASSPVPSEAKTCVSVDSTTAMVNADWLKRLREIVAEVVSAPDAEETATFTPEEVEAWIQSESKYENHRTLAMLRDYARLLARTTGGR